MSIQVHIWASKPHSGHISPPPRPREFHFTPIPVLRFASQHYPSESCLTSIQVQIHESDPHPGCYIRFVTPSRSCITFIAVQRLASQPPLGPTWLPLRYRYLHPTSILVPTWAFPHPGHIAPPLRPWHFVFITIHVLRFASQHHPVNASHASMSQDFESLPHPGLKTCISPPSRSCPTCI